MQYLHNTTSPAVKIHSACLQLGHRGASLNHFRAWLVLVKHAFQDNHIQGIGSPNKIALGHLWRSMGGRGQRNDRYLKELVKGLCKITVEANLLHKDRSGTEWTVSTLLAGATLSSGSLQFEFSSFLVRQLSAPRLFALLNPKVISAVSSKYALLIYALAQDYSGVGQTPAIPLSRFRALMGLEDGEYSDFKSLSRRVLKKPLVEVNAVSPLAVEVDFIKDGRAVSALRFRIQKKKQEGQPAPRPTPQQKTAFHSSSLQWGDCKGGEPDFTHASPVIGREAPPLAAAPASPMLGGPTPASPLGSELPPPQAAILRRLLKCGITEPQARHFLATYDPVRLRSNLDLVFSAMQRKTIENLPAFTFAAITNDWAAPARSIRAERKRRHTTALKSHEDFLEQHRQIAPTLNTLSN